MLLNSLPTGALTRVRAVSTSSQIVLRLREMGLRPGALVRVVGIGPARSVIVMIGAARLAVDSSTAALVEMEAA